ncbi:MAG TPA: hypothetical protein VGL22_21615 [Terracidiphilus sp.]
MKHFPILLILSCAAIATAATALTTISGSGGTLNAPTTIGQNITASNITLSGGGTANMSCPVTFFGAGTYQWNWTCSGGKLYRNGIVVASVSGTMKLSCSGGGRYNKTTCYHVFSGTATASGGSGSVAASAKGSTNNAPGTITSFSATW